MEIKNRTLTPNQEFEMRKLSKEKLASFYFDLAKLTFAGMVVGVFVPYITTHSIDETSVLLGFIGVCVTISFAFIATLIIHVK